MAFKGVVSGGQDPDSARRTVDRSPRVVKPGMKPLGRSPMAPTAAPMTGQRVQPWSGYRDIFALLCVRAGDVSKGNRR